MSAPPLQRNTTPKPHRPVKSRGVVDDFELVKPAPSDEHDAGLRGWWNRHPDALVAWVPREKASGKELTPSARVSVARRKGVSTFGQGKFVVRKITRPSDN